jgi:hypothetical protein
MSALSIIVDVLVLVVGFTATAGVEQVPPEIRIDDG